MSAKTYTGKFFLIQGVNVDSGAVDMLAVAFGAAEVMEFCLAATQNPALNYHGYRVVEGGDLVPPPAAQTHATSTASN